MAKRPPVKPLDNKTGDVLFALFQIKIPLCFSYKFFLLIEEKIVILHRFRET